MSGVFANTAPGSPSHIVNIDGNQAAYIISLPQAESPRWSPENTKPDSSTRSRSA